MQGLRTREASGLRTTDRRPRTPGVAYAVLTLVLATLVGTIALTSRQSAPPTIAEFAPQAVEQISESAEGEVDAGSGDADESRALDENAAADDATSAAVDVARVRQCVGDPPRQIEDPQSPPCVPYWSGDNGGATARGATRDEVRIGSNWGLQPQLVAFFNKRF